MKKISIILLIGIVVLAGITLLSKTDDTKYNIGFVYLMSHPAIDQGIAGYKEQLDIEFPDGEMTLNTIYSNANGEIKNINAIIQSYINKDVDAVIALTTPAAQVANRLISNKPVIFVGVSDPISAGLVDSLENGKNNVTGTTSKDPVFETLQLSLSVFPDVRSVGIIYSSFEANSNSILKKLEDKMTEENHSTIIVKKAVNSTADIFRVATSLANSVDAIFLINDNTVISAINILLKAADKAGIPVFASDIDSVKNGALLTLGLNYKDEGMASARILKSILVDQKSPETIPVYLNERYYLYVNKRLYKDFPNARHELLEHAEVVE